MASQRITARKPWWDTDMPIEPHSSSEPMVDGERGFTIIELLVTLVISSLLAIAAFAFYLSTSNIINDENNVNAMWQRGRMAMAFIRESVESAGFGLPPNVCPNGTYAYDSATGAGVLNLVPISASVQSGSSSYPYDPTALSGIDTYSLTAIAGGGAIGDGAAAQVVSIPSTKSADMVLSNDSLVNSNDLFVVQTSGGVCLFGQITSVNQGVGNANQNVVHNSGKSIFNPPNGFSALDGNLSTNQFVNANFYDEGQTGFYIDTFSIANPNGSTGVPTLYVTQSTFASTSQATPQAVARGIVDIQILYGVANGTLTGAVQQWITPALYNATSNGAILAVKVAILARTTIPAQNQTSQPSYDLLGQVFKVPSSGGQAQGCQNGNCQAYTYHVFEETIPVRNAIWGES
ncbi:MAG: PilW family protein [Acidithiobacillus ferrooxidans]|nr:PilW family protein [Acidithiobacillus ferrooxidans]MDD5003834.1 PilW family protein [Acidithiobacillus sp.]MDD5379078.1 PilW family protein [Acidithiobacillus sp.]MDD5575736.1 PilW family protein [Acidithiobacillus sp.]